jgi:hypothetical protein
MRSYIVLWEYVQGNEDDGKVLAYHEIDEVDARSAEHACRLVAEGDLKPALAAEIDDTGLTLRAVPARNWNSGRNTFKAETQRRLLRS